MWLFGINMPLLYGEGHRAFHRLQEETMKIHEDYTLFAWANPGASIAGHCNPADSLTSYHSDGILAESPRYFSKKKWSEPWWLYSQLYPSIMSTALGNEDLKHSITGWQFMQQLPTITSRGLSISLPLRLPARFWDGMNLLDNYPSNGSKSKQTRTAPSWNQFYCAKNILRELIRMSSFSTAFVTTTKF